MDSTISQSILSLQSHLLPNSQQKGSVLLGW